jgi:hypothetical protein
LSAGAKASEITKSVSDAPVPAFKRPAFIFLACGALVAIPFLSALTHVFDYHDSFYFFAYDHHMQCWRHPQFNSFFLVGRPLYAYLNCLLSGLVRTLPQTIFVRLIGLAVCIGAAGWIVRVLREEGMPALVAVVAACSLIWLPGFQFVIAMSQAEPVVFTLPLAILAFVELRSGLDTLNRSGFRAASRSFILTSLYVLIAAEIYQPMSSLFFCLVFAATWHLGPSLLNKGRLLIAGSIAVFAVQGVLYLLSFKLVVAPLYTHFTHRTVAEANAIDSSRDIAISTDIFGKLEFLYDAMTPNSFSLWLAGPPYPVYATVLALTALAVGAAFVLDLHAARQATIWRQWAFAFEKLIWLGALVLLVNAPILLPKTGTIALRAEIPYQWLIVLVLLSSGWRVVEAIGSAAAFRIGQGALFCFAAIGIVAASWNLHRNFVLPNAGEFSFVRQALGDYLPTESAPACVIQPGMLNVGSLAEEHFEMLTDEFGKLTTMFPTDVPWIVSAVVKSRTRRLNSNTRILKPDEPPADLNCGVVIDMRVYAARIAQLSLADVLLFRTSAPE